MSDAERIKEQSRGLRGPLDQELANDESHFTEDAKTILKFHGSYEQDDRDQRRARKKAGLEPVYSFMTRSRIPGGVLTADQYLAHDDLASRFGTGTLRVTTRQTLQLHGVVKANLRSTIRSLNDALVSTLATCGDVNRNVVSCPAPLPQRLRAEAIEMARRISDHLLPRTRAYHEIWIERSFPSEPDALRAAGQGTAESESDRDLVAGGEPEPDPIYENRYLPRKFKTAIAFPDDNCTDVYSNDLGFLVVHDHERLLGFNVLVGGGLGQTHGKENTYPRLADPLAFVTPAEVLDVAAAVITAQRDFGNRGDRKRARLKYLIDERGLDWFREEVEQRLGRSLAPPSPVTVTDVHDHLGWHEQGNGEWFYGVFIENGRIRDATREVLNRLVEQFRFGVRLTTQQNLLLTNIPEKHRAEVDRMLTDHGVRDLTSISTVRRFAMACPALPTCPLALAEAERALPGLIDQLEVELQQLGIADVPFTVRMTGCPNGCARPYTADLAFVGRSLDKYVVYLGGNMEGTRLNTAYADLVPRAQLVATVRPLLEQFARERHSDERFGDFWHRIGTP